MTNDTADDFKTKIAYLQSMGKKPAEHLLTFGENDHAYYINPLTGTLVDLESMHSENLTAPALKLKAQTVEGFAQAFERYQQGGQSIVLFSSDLNPRDLKVTVQAILDAREKKQAALMATVDMRQLQFGQNTITLTATASEAWETLINMSGTQLSQRKFRNFLQGMRRYVVEASAMRELISDLKVTEKVEASDVQFENGHSRVTFEKAVDVASADGVQLPDFIDIRIAPFKGLAIYVECQLDLVADVEDGKLSITPTLFDPEGVANDAVSALREDLEAHLVGEVPLIV